MLKKCLADAPAKIVPIKDVQIDDSLNIMDEPLEILDRQVKQMRQSRIPLVKVRWSASHGHEFTWEREDFMKEKYPQLFK